jgi:hypothetical protein
MRGLNEWLERDVHDRQSELRGVVARVDQLRDDIRGIRQTGLLSRFIMLYPTHSGLKFVQERVTLAHPLRANRLNHHSRVSYRQHPI